MNNNKKVLVVDDDMRNIFAISAVLRSKGYICLSAQSAQEGIDKVMGDADIGIVLLDMMMPDMDGYTAINHIRHQPAIASIPIIAVTAQAMQGDRERCLAAGANEYISKPIDTTLLTRSLNKYLK
jgi:CheY-like chemotaxis protein